jgi:hypothetical protein
MNPAMMMAMMARCKRLALRDGLIMCFLALEGIGGDSCRERVDLCAIWRGYALEEAPVETPRPWGGASRRKAGVHAEPHATPLSQRYKAERAAPGGQATISSQLLRSLFRKIPSGYAYGRRRQAKTAEGTRPRLKGLRRR